MRKTNPRRLLSALDADAVGILDLRFSVFSGRLGPAEHAAVAVDEEPRILIAGIPRDHAAEDDLAAPEHEQIAADMAVDVHPPAEIHDQVSADVAAEPDLAPFDHPDVAADGAPEGVSLVDGDVPVDTASFVLHWRVRFGNRHVPSSCGRSQG